MSILLQDETALEEAVDMEIQNFFKNEMNDSTTNASSRIKPLAKLERWTYPFYLLSMMILCHELYKLQDTTMMINLFFTFMCWIHIIYHRTLYHYNNDMMIHKSTTSTFSQQKQMSEQLLERMVRCNYTNICINLILDSMTLGICWTNQFTYHNSTHSEGNVLILWMRLCIQLIGMFLSASILTKRCTKYDDPCLLLLPFSMVSLFDHAQTIGNLTFFYFTTNNNNSNHSSQWSWWCCNKNQRSKKNTTTTSS